MDAAAARDRFGAARVARLATVGPDHQPHLVPVVFALADQAIVSAVDHKPKTTPKLRRLRNIEESGRATLLVDHYEEDWSRLWWVRADGRADILQADSVRGRRGLDALQEKYRQYAGRRPAGPVIVIHDVAWTCWSAGSTS